MEIRKLANEMVDTLREGVWNKIDQEVTNERWNNIHNKDCSELSRKADYAW